MRIDGGPGQIMNLNIKKTSYINDTKYMLIHTWNDIKDNMTKQLGDYRPGEFVFFLQLFYMYTTIVKTAAQTGMSEHLCYECVEAVTVRQAAVMCNDSVLCLSKSESGVLCLAVSLLPRLLN
jgi:hypothetical protein